MEIGLFGGTFDPVHNAHLRLALAFKRELSLDTVYLIPAGMPYHRSQQPVASSQQRLEMVRLAISGLTGLQVDDREVRRQHAAYTVETLQEIRQEIGQELPVWWLIGADAFALLHTWKNWEELLQLTNLAIAPRPGFSFDALPQDLQVLWAQSQQPLQHQPAGQVHCLDLPPVALSATALRDRLKNDASPTADIPTAVQAYIREQGLYR